MTLSYRPVLNRPHPYCRICGGMIDGLGAEMGKTRCWFCETPAQGIEARQGHDPKGHGAEHESPVGKADAPEQSGVDLSEEREG